ncbi:MAG: NUDIX hydrolase [Deltaproteobacteria bacterium]|nr:NUDIX hydrolase [Deltaproteobacteria bacterium]
MLIRRIIPPVKRELVAGLIIVRGRALMMHNVKHGLRIEPPGGKVHEGEKYEDALIREIREELGAAAGNLRFLGVYETDSPEGDFPVHTFLCDIIEGKPRNAEPEKFLRFGWHSFKELLRFKEEGALVPNIARALEELKGLMKPQDSA